MLFYSSGSLVELALLGLSVDGEAYSPDRYFFRERDGASLTTNS